MNYDLTHGGELTYTIIGLAMRGYPNFNTTPLTDGIRRCVL